MPYCRLSTSQTVSDEVSSDLMAELSRAMATGTSKSEQYVMIEIATGQQIMFAGGSEPAAYVECKSIGLSRSQAKELAATLPALLQNRLQLDPGRIYIEFSNCPAEFWGWNGKTFG